MILRLFFSSFIIISSCFVFEVLANTEKPNDKYKDFRLELNEGLNTRELRTRSISIPEEVLGLINEKYADIELNKLGISSAIEFNEGVYALLGGFSSVKKPYTDCNYLIPSKPYENCGTYFMSFVDLNKEYIERVDNRNIPEIGVNSLMERGGLQGYDSYGCYSNYALQSADLDLDGFNEVFFFGGSGEFEHRGEGKNIQSVLRIFSGKNYKNIFTEEISYENFVGRDTYNFYVNSQRAVNYQYISNSYLDQMGVQVQDAIKPSLRRYSKFYFVDVDKNGLLDILVWRKYLKSRKSNDPIQGYEIVDTSYFRYEQDKLGFKKVPVSNDTMKKLLEEFSLTWSQGLPNKNYCEGLGMQGNIPVKIEGRKLTDM